jgi:hypothetical protein
MPEMKELDKKGYNDEDEFREILEKLREIKKAEGKLIDFNEDEDEEDEDSEYEVGDELIYTAGDLELYDSPLEKIDAPIYFKNVMDTLSSQNPELYHILVSEITHEQNEQLLKNFDKNEELLKLQKNEEA